VETHGEREREKRERERRYGSAKLDNPHEFVEGGTLFARRFFVGV
jgi:hypothetical protein